MNICHSCGNDAGWECDCCSLDVLDGEILTMVRSCCGSHYGEACKSDCKRVVNADILACLLLIEQNAG